VTNLSLACMSNRRSHSVPETAYLSRSHLINIF
jgi:hypothetical protein